MLETNEGKKTIYEFANTLCLTFQPSHGRNINRQNHVIQAWYAWYLRSYEVDPWEWYVPFMRGYLSILGGNSAEN